MAVLSRRKRDPEGRMPLRAHLIEFRNRLLVSAAAVFAASIIGWYLYEWLLFQITEPLELVREGGRDSLIINYQGLTTAFNQRLLLSVWVGVIIASPVWIYQLWAFITPGLTRKERWYAVGFVAASVPLFLSGVALAWLVLPNAVEFLIAFTPDDTLSASILPANDYLSFVMRLLLAAGIAFLTPVVMVALTMVGLVAGRTWLHGWRIAIVVCFIFAAIASPTPDPLMMFVLAGPMILLYMIAVGFSVFVDRRRRRRLGLTGTVDLDDETASALPDDPDPVDGADEVDQASAIVTAEDLDTVSTRAAEDTREGTRQSLTDAT